MKTNIASIAVWILSLGLATALAEETDTIVLKALKEEITAFDDVESRWDKGKLKQTEKAFLFGKKALTKSEQRERLDAVRKEVERGEVSLHVFNFLDPRLGHRESRACRSQNRCSAVAVNPATRLDRAGAADRQPSRPVPGRSLRERIADTLY